MALCEKVTLDSNGLIGGPEIALLTKNVELTAAKEMKRGTLLTTTSGKVAATAKAGVADCILAEDTDSKAKVATVYISGRFNREKLIVAEGDTVDAHEEELRDKNIYLTKLK